MNSTFKATVCCTILMIAIAFEGRAQNNFIKNPIVPGYYADPTIIKDNNSYYIYATIDPWGAAELGVLETKDFKTFVQRHLNWPTKPACISPTSNSNMVDRFLQRRGMEKNCSLLSLRPGRWPKNPERCNPLVDKNRPLGSFGYPDR